MVISTSVDKLRNQVDKPKGHISSTPINKLFNISLSLLNRLSTPPVPVYVTPVGKLMSNVELRCLEMCDQPHHHVCSLECFISVELFNSNLVKMELSCWLSRGLIDEEVVRWLSLQEVKVPSNVKSPPSQTNKSWWKSAGKVSQILYKYPGAALFTKINYDAVVVECAWDQLILKKDKIWSQLSLAPV